ncbi:MAG: SpoIIE family protein phosphatase [Bacteroidales bacterium]
MLKLFYTLSIFLIWTLNIFAVSSEEKPLAKHYERQPFKNFTQREYGDTCSAQNWAITEDAHGVLYFGNAYRVLQYDGEAWNTSRIPLHGVYVTALMEGRDKNIYVGANGEFGFLKPNSIGKLEYVSLSDSLEIEDSFFSNVWRIYNYDEQVLFFSQEKIFLWDGSQIKTIEPETSFHLAFVVNGILYARQREIGLMKYNGNAFELLKNGEIFSDYGIFGIFPGDDNEDFLLVSQEIGLFKYSPISSKGIVSQDSPYTRFLNKAQIIGGIKLHNGLFALNTLNNGVIIINSEGDITQIIDQNTGLPGNEVKQVYQDRNNNLWMSLNSGISMLNYNTGIAVYDYNTGLWGTPQSAVLHENQLYAGTSIGLFKKIVYPDDKVFKHFKQIGDINLDVEKMISVRDNLIIGSPDGLFVWNNRTGLKQIDDIDASSIYFSEEKELLIALGENGLFIYTTKPKIRQLASYRELSSANSLNIQEVTSDNELLELWIGTLNEGAWNVIIKPDFTYELDIYLGQQTGLGQTWVRPFKYDDEVLFGVSSGLMKFLRDSTAQTSDSTGEKRKLGYFDYVDIPGVDSVSVLFVSQDHNRTWASFDNKIYYGKDFNNLKHRPFNVINAGRIFNIFPLDSAVVWLAADDGLIKVNTLWRDDYTQNPLISFRKILTTNDSVIFYSPERIEPERIISLPYSSNRIVFEFASPFYENGNKAKYSFWLEGFEERWSEWSESNFKDYINLREGEYTFFVKAKDIYDNESEAISFVFRIMPPWYRTSWAYVGYGLLAILIIFGIVKLSLMRLKAKNIQLEKIIEKRTEEIRAQKDEISRQHKLVVRQKEEITSSIRYASRIQNALVPDEEFLKSYIPESFIFWIPRDIVSGDFYWVKVSEPYISIVAADCTGHGVPGAFMSMLGIAFLNELALREEPGKVSSVLEQLRGKIKTTLGQTGNRSEQKDGMDLAFCTINMETNTLYYAGANNPLYLIRNNEIIEYKATRNPIGIHHREKAFETHTIDLKKDDVIYLFSDGYRDQFGGDKGLCMGKNAFRELLLEIHNMPVLKQKDILEQRLKGWMRDEYFQIDDILIVGLKI